MKRKQFLKGNRCKK